ncbi:MAG: M28 family peptidase [Planctomycetota bacterium]
MTHRSPSQALLASSALLLGSVAASCSSSGDTVPESSGFSLGLGGHVGPAVAIGEVGTGPARFIGPMLGMFERQAAMTIAAEIDAQYRSPASDGYEAALESVLAGLYGAGFGADAGFELDVISEPMSAPAWTPLSAEINVLGKRGDEFVVKVPLASFEDAKDEFRLLLAEGAPACEVRGPAVFRLEDVTPGAILVTTRSVRDVEQDAVEKGAAAIVSWYQLAYCVDPTGKDRHIDAIFHGSVRPGSAIPSFYVSPRIADVMELASKRGSEFELVGRVKTNIRDLRTVVASVQGTSRADESIYVVSAVSGAGANDNAAGAAGIIEAARTLKRLIASGQIERPQRTIRFVFGKEAEAGKTALDRFDDEPVAAVVADMISASYAQTGAICLLERGWDPAALASLPPDAHTPWGAGSVVEEDIIPNGLSVVLREALVDVGKNTAEESGVPWSTREHPWEGGSDHDAFLAQGVPAALVWHFTDFAYSTSLDRMSHVDSEELRRTAVAIVAAAAALADARPGDLPRYLESLAIERQLRLKAVDAGDAPAGLRDLWVDWFTGAEAWLSAVTQGQPVPDLPGLRALDSFGD